MPGLSLSIAPALAVGDFAKTTATLNDGNNPGDWYVKEASPPVSASWSRNSGAGSSHPTETRPPYPAADRSHVPFGVAELNLGTDH